MILDIGNIGNHSSVQIHALYVETERVTLQYIN